MPLHGSDIPILIQVNSGLQKKDQWTGYAHDGGIIYNPNISPLEKRVYFRFDNKSNPRGYYFLSNQVTNDVRLTNWWWAFIGDSAGTLWQAVERGALSKNFPGVTSSIINHMVKTGVVSPDEFKNMGVERIQKVLLDYTKIALEYNTEMTRKIISNKLTQEAFMNIKPGEKLLVYIWYRYGPYPEPSHEFTVTKVLSDSVYFGKMVLSWDDIKNNAEFLKIKK